MSTSSNSENNSMPSFLLKSPFTSKISNYYLPCTFKIPKDLKTYDGTTDPDDHLHLFECIMRIHSLPEPAWCKLFRFTLIGDAARWFETLPHDSISTYSQLAKSFEIHFIFLKISPMTYASMIMDIKQEPDEPLKVFVARFKERILGIRKRTDGYWIASFISGLRSGSFLRDLMDRPPSTLEDLMDRAESFDRSLQLTFNMKNAKRDRGQSDDGSSSLSDSPYESDCILEFDGAVKGNRGLAGAGVVLLDVDGSLVSFVREGLGSVSKQVDEYKALILGLKYALKRGFSRIHVQGDSKLVYMQVCGFWRVKSHDMSYLCNVVNDLKEKFISFKISHVDRESNSRADDQANMVVYLRNGEVQEEVIGDSPDFEPLQEWQLESLSSANQ
ncbi:polynucleotidyl transferase, ribonuclease H-like superfamily protein [Artemisia annua]|uniref:Polynucleotidyl transferase, ribonuclease H-like superfamily protein n=1 Tax=Artemisia annua TaxID=35608 RepID=A0A2U1QGM4_ARTAN|nr:polynucleotidyl transferase, ribonuclease H-like superfamily protein [Artemisia annua]